MNNDLLRQYASLSGKKTELELKLDDVMTQMKTLEPRLLDEFSQAGVQRATVTTAEFQDENGVTQTVRATVYLERKLWCKIVDGDKERAIAALKEAGQDWDVFIQEGFNSNTLSARLRELDRDGEALPPPLVGAIETSEVFSLRVRKG